MNTLISQRVTFLFSKCLDDIRVILEPAYRYGGIEHTASDIWVVFFGQFCRLEEVRILNGLIKNMIVLYLQIFITNNIFVSNS